ncbi:D-alanyl-D-alanine carboxypeptidase/D-alanyl-D-alanine-endopeptidase [Actinoplanes sp. TBRC 11911]|nr:D-alanyl-D-alanine carboxypeptidase/D-alanyl-D-alanine-endopeptidase [Actinoplanes sp. TBRC 11911]
MARTTDGQQPVEAVGVRKSRIKWIYALSGLVVVILVVATIGLVKPGPVKGWLDAERETAAPYVPAPDPLPTPVLAAAEGGGQAPTEAGVKAALDALVTSAAMGTKVNVAVLDVASDQVLYERNAEDMATPASTTKLLAAAAILKARGPAYRLSTRAVAGPEPGDVVLVGGGDPTLSVGAKQYFPGAARLDRLAAQVKTALGGTKPARVLVDTSLFSGPETGQGWDSDNITPGGQVSRIQPLMTDGGRAKPTHHEFGGDPRSPDPAIAAGKAFAKLIGAPTGTVKRAPAPATAAQLGVVQSPPLVQLTDWMLEQSDNTLAEVLGRQAALAGGDPATFDGTATAVLDQLNALGLPVDQAKLSDSSGLSRRNGISPTMLTQLLALAASGKEPGLSSMFSGLPVAGWSGTLEGRFASPKPNQIAHGVVRAKTGTLSGVNTMAGQLITRDGRLLVFAIMASGSTDAAGGKAALDKVAAKLVGCGC